MNNQKIGGIAGIIEAVLYIIGFVVLFFFMAPAMDTDKTELDKLKFVLDNKALFQYWNLLIYVIFGLVLIPLTIAIHENFKDKSLIGIKVIPILGFIWSCLVISSGMIANIGLETVNDLFTENNTVALTSWRIIESIQNGLGGGVEVVGGLWVFLISGYGLREKVFHKALNFLGLIVGVSGIVTMIPGLKDVGAIFGLTQIFWFVWIGIIMLKHKTQKVN